MKRILKLILTSFFNVLASPEGNNAGVRKDVFKSKRSLALSYRNHFATSRVEKEIAGENFTTIESKKPESRVVALTRTYKINNYRCRA